MSASPAEPNPSEVSPVLSEIAARHTVLVGTDPVRGSMSPQWRLENFALAAACYALPDYCRELDRDDVPRLWPFQRVFQGDLGRREELAVAATYLLAAVGEFEPGGGPDRITVSVLARIQRVRDLLAGPTGSDPAMSDRASAADALAFAAACYSLPSWARELGTWGTPLLWPWPRALFRVLVREAELTLACAMVLAEIERQDRVYPPRKPGKSAPGGRLRVIDGGVVVVTK